MANQNQGQGENQQQVQADAQQKLEKLSTQIKAEHERVISTYRKCLDHARKVGELLSKARDLCHTSSTPWSSWVKTHTSISVPTVNGYIRVYEQWQQIEPHLAKVNTIKAALDLLKPKTQRTRKGRGILLPKAKLNSVAQARGLSPDLVLAILVDLGLRVELVEEEQPLAA